MPIELRQLLEGLDDSTISKVEETIKGNAKELDAKLFIDGEGEHYIPHARFDEVVNQRDSANSSIKDYQAQIEELGEQVEAGSKANDRLHAVIPRSVLAPERNACALVSVGQKGTSEPV